MSPKCKDEGSTICHMHQHAAYHAVYDLYIDVSTHAENTSLRLYGDGTNCV